MPSSKTSSQGVAGEIAAARKFDLDGAGGAGYADLRASNGVPVQVKSTVHTRADGSPGRFRFERQNFEQLREQPAAVALVLFPSVGSRSRRPLRVQKLPASEVASVIEDRGGWVRAGHASFSEQARLEWSALVDW